jgi:hypothetical protein
VGAVRASGLLTGVNEVLRDLPYTNGGLITPTIPSELASRTQSYCSEGDPVCDTYDGNTINLPIPFRDSPHTHYQTSPYFNLGVSFAVSRIAAALDVTTRGSCTVSGVVRSGGSVIGMTAPSIHGHEPVRIQPGETITYTALFAQPSTNLTWEVWAGGVPTALGSGQYSGPPADSFSGQYLIPPLPNGIYGLIPVHLVVNGDQQCTIDGTVCVPAPQEVKAATAAVGVLAIVLLALLAFL